MSDYTAQASLRPAADRLTSRWTMPILRVGMAVFLLSWGVDKFVAVDGALGIFERFYGLRVGAWLVYAAGAAEILLALLLAAGRLRRPVAWLVLVVNAISTLASWRQILDPWGLLGLGKGSTHLFLASIVIMAVAIVLVLDAERDRRVASLQGAR